MHHLWTSSATCLLFCIFLCASHRESWRPDPVQVNAKTSTDFLSQKRFHPFSVLVVASMTKYILAVIKLLCRTSKFLCNSSFNPPMFHWFWDRKSRCLGSPKNKSETCFVFYTVNSEYLYCHFVKELHISCPSNRKKSVVLALLVGVMEIWCLRIDLWLYQFDFRIVCERGTSAFPACLFITSGWM